MGYLPVEDLVNDIFPDKKELRSLAATGIEEFMLAISFLQSAGVSQAHVQWLVGRPFRAFGDDECLVVKIMALAVERNRGRVAEWHKRLRNAVYWSRMHQYGFGFPPDTLPDIDAINAEFGLSYGKKSPADASASAVGRLSPPNSIEKEQPWTK